MSVARGIVVAGWVLIWLGAVGVGAAAGQGTERVAAPLGMLPTVSVASLRIPEKAWTHYERAQDALQANHLEEYERETAKALQIAPKFAAVYLLRATHELRVHHCDVAIADVLAAQRIEPGAAWSGVLLASAYNGTRRFDDAAVILKNLVGAEADTWQAKYEWTRAAIGRGDVEGALHWSEMALDMAPEGCAEVHLLRANALNLAQRWPAAIAELQTYLDSGNPRHRAEVLVLLERTRSLAGGQTGATMASR
jgi:tetratricopeptide (TPR) repeat protein